MMVADSNEALPSLSLGEEHEAAGMESWMDDGRGCNALAADDDDVVSTRRASVRQSDFVEAVEGLIVLYCILYGV